MMRGLELPGIDDDPSLWAEDRVEKRGFRKDDVKDAA